MTMYTTTLEHNNSIPRNSYSTSTASPLQVPLQQTSRKRRMNSFTRLVVYTSTAAVVLVSASVASAFVPATLPTTGIGIGNDITGPRPLSQHQLRSGHLAAVTDPDLLLQETIRSQRSLAEDLYRRAPAKANNNNNKLKSKKTLTAADPPSYINQLASVPVDSLREKKTTSLQQRRQRRPPIQQRTAAPVRRSRSSTMPGFTGKSDRQIAFRDGVRLAEQQSGRKIADSESARAKRRATNGSSMYKNSACVPDSLVQFADEIHREDRITRKEEISLGEKTQDAIKLQALFDKLEESLERMPTDEEWCAAAGKINMEAVRQTIDEGLAAKNKLVTANLRMVQSVVNTYIRNGLSGQYNAGDMMQEGILALIRAAEKFEPDRGWRFSTYALYWIRSSVKRTQIFQSRIVAVPQRLFENHKRLLRVEQEMHTLLGHKPSRKELGAAVGMSELQVERCIKAMEQRCYSLDRELSNGRKPMSGDSNGDTLYDLVKSKTDDNEYNKLQSGLLREDLIETLNRHLSSDEVELLLLRFGLKDGPSRKLGGQPTIAELSEMVGLKPDKVRRIINKSLRQLKQAGGDEWLAFDRAMQ